MITHVPFLFLSTLLTAARAAKFQLPAGMSCPPPILTSYYELQHYCPYPYVGMDENSANCKDINRVSVCGGKIDNTLDPPPCSQNIASCDAYFDVCAKEPGGGFDGSSKAYCGEEFGYPNTFVCWNKQDDQWCQGHVEVEGGATQEPPSTATSPNNDNAGEGGVEQISYDPPEEISETGGGSAFIEESSVEAELATFVEEESQGKNGMEMLFVYVGIALLVTALAFVIRHNRRRQVQYSFDTGYRSVELSSMF
jgi:hypothetical protein